MISWIQHHLIRHGRWIFLTLLAVIIVAFVFTIGNTPGCTADRSNYEPNLFYGVDLNSKIETDSIDRRVTLSAILNGQQLRSEQEFINQRKARIAVLHLAGEMGVPNPTQEILGTYIQTKNAFRGPDNQFSQDRYTSFVDGLETNPEFKKIFQPVLEEDFRIDQVFKAFAGPGYLLPSEAIEDVKRARTKLKLSTAEISFDEFEPEIAPDAEALKAYYEAQKARYEIPERVQASYALFKAVDHMAKIEVEEAELRDHFASNRAFFVAEYEIANPTPEPAEGEETPEPKEVSFEDVREAVTENLKEKAASTEANKAALEFIMQLYNNEIELDSAAFNQLLSEKNINLIEIEPYTRSGARQRALSTALLESAFALASNRYYSDAYPVEEGFAVLIHKGRISAEIPAYEIVAEEVAADYTADKKDSLFQEKGNSLKAELEAAIAAGSDFKATAKTLGLATDSYETFQVNEAPFELNRMLLQTAQSMSAGEVSEMIELMGTGTFIYLEEKEISEIAQDDAELAATTDRLKRFASILTGSDLTGELVSRGEPAEEAPEKTVE